MNNKKVISFNHANYSPLIYNNPFNEAGEFAFCNYYVDYGKRKFKKIWRYCNLMYLLFFETILYKDIIKLYNCYIKNVNYE